METLTAEEAATMGPIEPNEPLARPRRMKSPVAAGIMSSMPGLGQVYVGYYRRGFTHLLVVAATITMLNSQGIKGIEPMFGLFLSFYWIFNIVDAVRLANLYNDAMAGLGPEDLRRELSLRGSRGSLGGGIALLVLGVVLLSHTLFDVSLDWVKDWWPLLPVGFGIYLLYMGIKERRGTRA